MKTIYQYPFEISDIVTVLMPAAAEIVKVECQNGGACIWALVDSGWKNEPHRFRVFGTGHEIPSQFKSVHHIATFQQGPFVWHLFDDNW